MNPITLAIDSPLMRALGWTLVHFIWQGACAGAVYAVVRYALRYRTPSARYHLAMLALAIMAVMPIVTLIHVLAAPSAGIQGRTLASLSVSAVALPPTALHASGVGESVPVMARFLMQRLVPWTVPFWLLGVMIMSLRVWRGWEHTRFLRRTAVSSALPAWKASVDRLQNILGIHKVVHIAVSAGVTVPSVIGWLKPIILIPPSVLTGLTPLQMELILAHELAHIRRQDYLWNLLQIFVDTLLFYHPVVRWVSHHARMEREQCCDDIVVNLNGDAINYARALTELERLRTPRSSMVLGADGGQVIHRIHRLIGMPAADISPLSWALPLLALSLLITGSLTRIPFQKSALPFFHGQAKPVVESTFDKHASNTTGARIALQATHVEIDSPRIAPLHPVAETSGFNPITLANPEPAQQADIASDTPLEFHKPAVVRAGGEIIERHPPQYPQYAQERGIEGSSTVTFMLTASGEINDVHVTRFRGSRLFGQAAVNAIKQWKFTPVTLNGNPVNQPMTQEFDFRLNDPEAKAGTCRIPIGFHICTRG